MYCIHCGQRLADGARVCPSCGAAIPYNPDGETGEEYDPGRVTPDDHGSQSYSDDWNSRYGGYGRNDSQNYSGYNSYHSGAANGYPQEYAESPTRKADGYAVAGLVFSILGAVCCCLPYIGVVLCVAGIVLSSLGLKSSIRKTMAVIGLVVGIVSFVLNATILIAAIVLMSNPDQLEALYESIFHENFMR
ncbi:MAG: hypothetical protein II882_09795 [Lachnospiraceae bacterium]|nr:hypothetical protein [Lachnospiraceae bacterium]